MPKEIEWTEPMPHCNFGATEHEGPIDGPTIYGKWANMCPEHFKMFGYEDSTITTIKIRPNPSS